MSLEFLFGVEWVNKWFILYEITYFLMFLNVFLKIKSLTCNFLPLCVCRSGEGNHYGTFSGPISAFSPVSKGKKPHQPEGKNFLTNPPKEGTGYGYLNVTIGAPYKYASEPYDKAKEIRRVRHLLLIKY